MSTIPRRKPSGLLFAFLLLAVARSAAQTLPDAPAPRLDRTEWALLAADAAGRALDVYSTERAIAGGDHEVVLPGWIADHTAAMTAYSGGAIGLEYWAARRLFRDHHHKWAYALTIADCSVSMPWAIHNLFVPGTPATSSTGNSPSIPIPHPDIARALNVRP